MPRIVCLAMGGVNSKYGYFAKLAYLSGVGSILSEAELYVEELVKSLYAVNFNRKRFGGQTSPADEGREPLPAESELHAQGTLDHTRSAADHACSGPYRRGRSAAHGLR